MAELPPPRPPVRLSPAGAWQTSGAYPPPPGARSDPISLPPLEGLARHVVRVELLVMLFVAAAPNLVFGLSGISRPRSINTDVSVLTLIASLLAALGPAVFAVFLLWRDGVLRRAGFA